MSETNITVYLQPCYASRFNDNNINRENKFFTTNLKSNSITTFIVHNVIYNR